MLLPLRLLVVLHCSLPLRLGLAEARGAAAASGQAAAAVGRGGGRVPAPTRGRLKRTDERLPVWAAEADPYGAPLPPPTDPFAKCGFDEARPARQTLKFAPWSMQRALLTTARETPPRYRCAKRTF